MNRSKKRYIQSNFLFKVMSPTYLDEDDFYGSISFISESDCLGGSDNCDFLSFRLYRVVNL